jgi:hypothetical protein
MENNLRITAESVTLTQTLPEKMKDHAGRDTSEFQSRQWECNPEQAEKHIPTWNDLPDAAKDEIRDCARDARERKKTGSGSTRATQSFAYVDGEAIQTVANGEPVADAPQSIASALSRALDWIA